MNELDITQLSQQIADTHFMVDRHLNDMYKFIEKRSIPGRKKISSFSVTQDNNCGLLILRHFDDGTRDGANIFTHYVGPFSLSQIISVENSESSELYVMQFPKIGKYIVLNHSKISDAYIYNLFLQSGFSYNQLLPRAKIQRGLREFVEQQIANCQTTLTLPKLHGWYQQRFWHSQNCLQSPELRTWPIASKTFEQLPIENMTLPIYTEALLKFKDNSSRLMVFLYPFVSILSSIFKDFRGPVNFSLNLIPTESLQIENVLEMFQIFTRQVSSVLSLESSRKTILKTLRDSKDESILMDLRLLECNDYYRKQLRQDRFDYISSILHGRCNLPNQTEQSASAGLITICDEIILRHNVFNIIVENEFSNLKDCNGYHINLFKEHKIMPRIMSQFVKYIESLGDDFFNVFTRKCYAQSHAGAIMEITYNLLLEFGEKSNFDFQKMLNFPKAIDFDHLLLPESESDNEDLMIFIDKITESVCNYEIVQKNTVNVCKDTIFYDSEYLYIPEAIFSELCHSFGLKDFRKYLLKLRSEGGLSTSQDRLLKQVVVNHQHLTCYVFKRDIFRHVGQIDICFLGKGDFLC